MKISLSALALVAGCGQMYEGPSTPPPATSPTGAPGGPPGAGPGGMDPWQAQNPPATPGPAPHPTSDLAPNPPPHGGPRPVNIPDEPVHVGQQLVTEHNRHRAKHCAAPLTWSPELAAYAQRWANTLRDKGCAFEHSRGAHGENLAAGTTGTLDASSVVAMWYDEVKGYSFQQPGFSMQTGHFTQVVWKGTTRIGCATSTCKGMDIWVCEYDPPGNWEGRYRDQVLPVGCK